jgi:hypothetical protein
VLLTLCNIRRWWCFKGISAVCVTVQIPPFDRFTTPLVSNLDGRHVNVRDELRGRKSWISVLQVFAPRTILEWI